MTVLNGALSATDKVIVVSGDDPDIGSNLRVDDEVIVVVGHTFEPLSPYERIDHGFRVWRGVGGTTPASHEDGATLTEVVRVYGTTPFSGSGGSDSDLLLTDPGATWQPEHLYSEGDRILVLGSVVMESRDDGLSDAEEPEWEVIANVSDGDIGWRALGEVGQVPVTMMPLGLNQFAYTSPSALLAGVDPAMQFYIGQHDTDEAAHDGVGSLAATVTDHMVRPVVGEPTHMLYTGSDDPTQAPGVAALMGSLYLRSTGDLGARLYVKVNPGDTNWQEVALV